ncbi:MAG: Na+-driven multidrug efflux pump, partial [Gammaproteobacteria bacterium]
TVVARGATMIIGYRELRKRNMISLELPSLPQLFDSWKSLAHVGLPAAGTNMIIPLGTGIVVAMIAGYGLDAVAGHGAAARIESLAMVVFLAMSSMIGPFVGQNLGAGKTDRIHEVMRLTGRFCVLFGLALALVIYFSAGYIMALFSNDPAVIEFGELYLITVTLGFGAAGIVMNVNASFNGLGRPLPGVVVSTARIFVFMIPAAWIGGELMGLQGIFAGVLVANLLAATLAYVWFQRKNSLNISPG